MRLLTRLGLVVAICALLFANANVIAERVAEDLVADAIAEAFDLGRRPDVDLTGFPILVRAVRGDLPDVRFTAARLVAGDLQIASLDVRLRGLRGNGSLLGGDYAISIAAGVATVVVDEAAVNALLAARGEDATVRINQGGVRVSTHIEFLGRRKVSAAARVRLRGQHLVIAPVRGSVTIDGEPAPPLLEERARREATITVVLPTLPGDVRPTSVALTPGEITIGASLAARTIDVR